MNEAIQSITNFYIKSVLLDSERLVSPVELTSVVTDIDIYEHIEKPYLTAKLVFSDTAEVISSNDLLGGETVLIVLQSNRKDTREIRKYFYVQRIENAIKINDATEVVVLKLIEDIGYISNAQNVNKSYTGNTAEIIEKIAYDYLNKLVSLEQDIDLEPYKVIIPNLNPLNAMSWLKNATNTNSGYPYFLFSTFVGKELYFKNLGNMLNQPSMNENKPYVYWQSASQSSDPDVQRRTIKEYSIAKHEDLFSIIQHGSVGAKYTFLNTLSNTAKRFNFNVKKDVFDKLTEQLPNTQNRMQFSDAYAINEKPLNEYQSRNITQICGSGVFNNGSESFRSLNEEILADNYKRKMVSKSMLHFLLKNPLNIIVNGVDFIDGDYNATIGNLLNIEFLTNRIDAKNQRRLRDAKRSGNYLIYGARHTFKVEGYDLSLSCVKIANKSLTAT